MGVILDALRKCDLPIDKYMFLRRLHDSNKHEYYQLMMRATEETLPFIYTPTVGEACQRYHQLPGLKTHGLYLSLADRGNILEKLQAWPQQKVRVCVVTDGERILGLGDLGTGGMGISEGKITLYTVAAGVDPEICLPVCLDVGTNNKKLLNDSTYPGLRQERVRGAKYDSFLDEFMRALQIWQPHILVQFEDFGNENAFRVLERHRIEHCCFNDDIQGTAAIALAAMLAASHAAGTPLEEQRILFMGAGEAGTGIGDLVAYCIHRTTNMTIQEARSHCLYFDSKGLVCAARTPDLAHHKLNYAHDLPFCKTLLEAVTVLKPTALIGVSATAGAFDEPVLRAMAAHSKHPIIFPLSNPTPQAECTFEQAWRWTEGSVIFASGSPFDPLVVDKAGRVLQNHKGQLPPGARRMRPAQANNAYIFPAIGAAVLAVRASHLSEEDFLVAARALAAETEHSKVLEEGQLFPPFSAILEVSARVAATLAQHLVQSGTGIRPAGCESGRGEAQAWLRHMQSRVWRGVRQTAAVEIPLQRTSTAKL